MLTSLSKIHLAVFKLFNYIRY